MKTQTQSEKVTEQYSIGTALGILAQYIPDTKLAIQVSKVGSELASKAQLSMQQEPGDVYCPPTAAERFLAWLRSHGGHPPVPADWYRNHIYEISPKPLPPKENIRLSPLAILANLNELYTSTRNPDIREQLVSVSGLISGSFSDEIDICGTPWKRGPIPGPR